MHDTGPKEKQQRDGGSCQAGDDVSQSYPANFHSRNGIIILSVVSDRKKQTVFEFNVALRPQRESSTEREGGERGRERGGERERERFLNMQPQTFLCSLAKGGDSEREFS